MNDYNMVNAAEHLGFMNFIYDPISWFATFLQFMFLYPLAHIWYFAAAACLAGLSMIAMEFIGRNRNK